MQIILSGKVQDNLDVLSTSERLAEMIRELVYHMGMEPVGDPIIKEFDSVYNRSDLGGLSACQFIVTSSITIHTYPEHQYIDLDLFSCLPIPGFAVDWLVDYLQLEPDEYLTLHKRGSFDSLPRTDGAKAIRFIP